MSVVVGVVENDDCDTLLHFLVSFTLMPLI